MNIILLVLDSVRASTLTEIRSRLSPEGGVRRLSEDGTVYRKAIAPSAWTVPSHASFLTGKHPSQHGINTPDARFRPQGSLPWKLSREGYATFGATANPFLGERNGFADAFQDFRHVIPTPETKRFPEGRDGLGLTRSINETGFTKLRTLFSKVRTSEAPVKTGANLLWYKLTQYKARRDRDRQSLSGADEITLSLIDLVKETDPPFFAFANYMEAHRPYCAPDPYIERFYPTDVSLSPDEVELDPWAHTLGIAEHTDDELRAAYGLYCAAIAFLDDQVGRLLAALDETGVREETIVVLTSDHGEAFGERGRLDHNCLYQPVTVVPLLIDHPRRGPTEVSEPVSLTSLAPTLLGEVGIEDTEEPTLFSDVEDQAPVISQYLQLHVKNLARRFDRDLIKPFREPVQSAFGREYQLIASEEGSEELIRMDGSVDPVDAEPAVSKRLRSVLPPFPDDAPGAPTIEGDGPVEDVLRALGYLE